MIVVKRLVDSENNDYDGYIMLNLYPQRTTDPSGLHVEKSDYAYEKNLEVISGYIKELTRDKKCVDIWAAWGGNIDRRDYLINVEKSDYAYEKNLEVISGYIKELTRDKKCVDIWAAWGGNIDRRDYLIKSLVDIEKMIRPYSVRWLEKGKYKNPHHPLYLKKTLEFEEYVRILLDGLKKVNIKIHIIHYILRKH